MFQLPQRYLPILLGWPLAVLGAWMLARSVLVPGDWAVLNSQGALWEVAFNDTNIGVMVVLLYLLGMISGAIMVAAGSLSVLRHPLAPRATAWAIWSGYAALSLYLLILLSVTTVIEESKLLPSYDVLARFYMRVDHGWWPLVIATGLGFLHLQWSRRTVLDLFRPMPPGATLGDRVVENLRSHGDDPDMRRSFYGSIFVHLWVLIIFPWLMSLQGCVENVKMPRGRGEATTIVQMEIKKQQKKKEKQKKYVVAKDAPIIFDLPTLEDSKVEELVDASSQAIYQPGIKGGAKKGAKKGKTGKRGSGGPGEGGWPNGFPDGQFEFYRVQYNGADWDDGMSAQRGNADVNFLNYMKERVPFPVAKVGKSTHMGQLTAYRKGMAPPFVFMTGASGINVSAAEVKAMREYLLGGGMLVADCGGAAWARSFQSFIQRVFPDYAYVTISKDDPLFQDPNGLGEEGPAPLWRHGGTDFKGVKAKNGRWMVFFHPGDMNDAWKDGHNGTAEHLWENAFMVGDNVTYYAVTHYLEETAKDQKR
ncbi:hypothetical protein LBMAG53_10390 [Planctomycetota bacterium]|nr:hypothetical protein LBMAG53_10390 [Planctomycetota bacterium]